MSPTYVSWMAMHARCTRPKCNRYENYGGRGIRVCERWDSFENFLADVGERPAGTTLDRIDSNGHYEPGNCRWATREEQWRNRRDARVYTLDGEALHIKDWAQRAGVTVDAIARRIRNGVDLRIALTTDPGRRGQPLGTR